MHILDFEDIPATTYCIVIKLIAEALSQLRHPLLSSQCPHIEKWNTELTTKSQLPAEGLGKPRWG